MVADTKRLKREALEVFDALVLPTWADSVRHGYPETLYGYVHSVFAVVDVLSCHWRCCQQRFERKCVLDARAFFPSVWPCLSHSVRA